MIYDVVPRDHVLTGPAAHASLFVFSRFDADGIVAGIKYAIINDYPVAGFDVEGIGRLRVPGIDNRYLVYGELFAVNRVYAPCRRVTERNTLQ